MGLAAKGRGCYEEINSLNSKHQAKQTFSPFCISHPSRLTREKERRGERGRKEERERERRRERGTKEGKGAKKKKKEFKIACVI